MNPLALLAPIFLLFELGQLVVSERYMGIKQIRVNADPRELPMPTWMAAVWSSTLIVYFLWMSTLLLYPVGRAQGVVLIATSLVGYSLRSTGGLMWVLVILTIEGSIRIGMLGSLFVMTFRQMLS